MTDLTRTSLVLRGGRLLDPGQGLDRPGDLLIEAGRIAAIGAAGTLSGEEVFQASGLVVCPGFIDVHCHLREPGFEEKETIATGTAAAAAGGFTTLCCMPNTEPPIDRAAVVEYVLKMARIEGMVRVLPIGCITLGRKGEQLTEMADLAQAGAVAFSDDGSPVASARLMRSALEYSSMLGVPVIDHCQDPSLSQGAVVHEGWVSTALGLKGEPAAAEEVMVERDLALAELTGGWVHIAHVSTAGSVERIRRAKARGVRVTAEVTPHHLTLTHEWVAGRASLPGVEAWNGWSLFPYDTSTKVNPPLRTVEDTRALLEGLRDGTIDAIATDHAPHDTPSKLCEYDDAAFGISGLETALGLLLTLVHSGQMDLGLLVQKLTAGPARLLGTRNEEQGTGRGQGLGSGFRVQGSGEGQGSRFRSQGSPEDRGTALDSRPSTLDSRLSTLAPGAPADIAIFDPEQTWVVDPFRMASKGKNTPLAGLTLRGRVVATIYGGSMVYRCG